MTIMKASAGSGKTFNLARSYIRLLLEDPDPGAFRHILAVTFTNKATEEMKTRVLKELHTLSTDCTASKYYKDFVPSLFKSSNQLQDKASRVLKSILHDYTSFSISTIDKFFQQTLRSFSREIGQVASYQVELDRDSLVREAADRVMDSVSEEGGGALLGWLTDSVLSGLGEGDRFRLEKDVADMAKSILGGDRDYSLGSRETFSRERLRSIRKACGSIISDYRRKVMDSARECTRIMEASGVDVSKSMYSFLMQTYAYTDLPPGKKIELPKDTLLRLAPDPEKWFAKDKRSMGEALAGTLAGPMARFAALFGKEYDTYITAFIIRRQIYGLGIGDELRQEFSAIQKEKNIISIEDSNTLLKDIIDGSDAPFVYEKLGVRYSHFLLDEFQDTSTVQWENFRPLIHNSNSSGGKNLVVGDVKQSIYRWRGSDWRLLDSTLEKEFSLGRDDIRVLDGNYRTLGEIVRFNNRFFPFAASVMDGILPGGGDISRIYRDVVQSVEVDDAAPGSLRLDFCAKDEMMDTILEAIREVLSSGGSLSDIAVLVRNNRDGEKISSYLVANGCKVISDDSLFVKSSLIVRRLVSALSLLTRSGLPQRSPASFLAREEGVTPPSSWNSLYGLCEDLLRSLTEKDPDTAAKEVPYILSFMDYVHEWSRSGGNSVSALLEDWEDADPKITSPRIPDAVRIMTIHKSKRLEFPYVIFPFAESVGLYREDVRWCEPALAGTPLEGKAEGEYKVNLDSSIEHSLFSGYLKDERRLQFIDNLNTFYVAMTRPRYGLRVIAAKTSESNLKKARKGDLSALKDLSQILRFYAEQQDSGLVPSSGENGRESFTLGQMYPFGTIETPPDNLGVIPLSLPSWPVSGEGGARISISPDAALYFDSCDEDSSIVMTPRVRGIVLHEILSAAVTLSDIPSAVEAQVASGSLPGSMKSEVIAYFTAKLSSGLPLEWFSPGLEVLRERDLMTPSGEILRPDRVVIRDGLVTVIDYKSGLPEPSHRRQVRRYADVFRSMGYKHVEGWLWYISPGAETEFIRVTE